MSLRNFAYDHPSYVARQALPLGAITAGSGGVTTKFVAHANMQIYGVTGVITVVGTSTSTATFPPQPPSTATTQVQANGQILNLIRITNTSTTSVPALATVTYGPFISGSLYANGTFTGVVGQQFQYPVNSLQIVGTATTAPNAALSNQGGVFAQQGDTLYVVSGTDASAVCSMTLDYQIQPLASVVA
jgi:hypothetical protein